MDQDTINRDFWNCIVQSDLPGALAALAHGAQVDYKNPDDHHCTALHKAVQNGNEIVVDFLLQWSSNVNQPDDDGYTSLHHAALSSNVRLVLSLLKRHAKSDVKDNDGKVNPLLCTPRKSNLLLR